MENQITVDLGGESVRFTSDGKVYVMDAIRLMTPGDKSPAVWERIKNDHPAILGYCEDDRTPQGEKICLVDTEGWDKIIEVLPEYLFAD